MTLKIGKLYSCSGYYLMLYSDKEAADTAAATALPAATSAAARRRPRARPNEGFGVEFFGTTEAATAAAVAAYWSKRFGKPVNYCNPETPLLVLSVKEEYIQVLAGDHKGWIINEDWLELKEIV